MRLPRLLSLFLCLLVAAACAPTETQPPAETEQDMVARARAIHERVVTLDTHIDIPGNYATPEVDPLNADRKVNLEKMKAGGLDVAFLAVYVGQGERTPAGYADAKASAMAKFDAIHRMAEQMHPDLIEVAYTPADVERIVGSGKLATVIGMENGYIIGKDLSLLKTYFDRGGRYVTLSHGGNNDICDSATPREGEGAEYGGLSPFGEQVVAEMNRLGILVDVSHTSEASALEAIRLSKAPVIASHSGVRALADVPRNMSDSLLLALKANGGVIQVVALGGYLKARPEYDEARRALMTEFGITRRGDMQNLAEDKRAALQARLDTLDAKYPGATLKDFMDHIDYAVKLIGVDHVGIGTDFDGGGGIPGFNDASEAPNVTLELVRRGYSEEDIAKIWGGNLLRAWREAERVAGEAQAGGGS
jgi:membrane dipeptidase